MVTQLRARILDKMEEEGLLHEEDNESDLETAKKVVEQRRRRQPGSIRKTDQLPYDCFREIVPEGSRKKGRKGRPLKANEKVEIVYKVLAQKELQKDVARYHRIGANTVSRLVTKAKKNKKFLSELLSSEEAEAGSRRRIAEIV